MPAYICVTHALSRREETDGFCRGLSRYGFRYVCIHEQTDPQHRAETLTEASLLIALTCPAAAEAETVASDIRFALGRGIPVLCVSMAENSLDERFCATAEGGAALIPAPKGDTPDRHTVALFVHRLFVRHLARLESCFTANRCVEDVYGHAVTAAVAAHKGDPKACYALGQAYERGEGVPKLEVEAAHWIYQAAAKGILDARVRMGELYLTGRGAERDPEAAVRLFTEAALAGDPRGNYHIGMCYLRGLGVMKDPQRARECLLAAAEEGYPPSLYELGLLYRDGIGGARDTRAAIRFLYQACRLGAEKAGLEMPLSTSSLPEGHRAVCVTMRQLRRTGLTALLARAREKQGLTLPEARIGEQTASCFSKNRVTRSVLPEDIWSHEIETAVEGTEPLNRSIPFSLSETAVTLGNLLAAGDPAAGVHPLPTLALAWYRYALRMGSTDAAYRLGDAYRRGFGVPADGKRAFRLFSLGAHRGDEKSRFALGVCYEQGIGTEPDPKQAFQNYETAAHAGYAPAENNLGGCYERGFGVVRDVTAAAEWYSRAAAELPEAACRLGLCHEYGLGVEKNEAKACRLYESAAEDGHPYACYRLALCYDRGVRREERMTSAPASLKTEAPAEDIILVTEKRETAPDHYRTARLLEKAARGGIAEASYALSLCYAAGRGVRRDEERSLACLTDAAEGGCVQACYALGLSYLEGRSLVRNPSRATACFAEAAALWTEGGELFGRDRHPEGILAERGMTVSEAAGAALYMMGYCVLYGIGDSGNPLVFARGGNLTSKDRVVLAADSFKKASYVDHVGALTALGDLYAYGLLTSPTASAEDEALRYYMEAARVGTNREYVSERAGDSPIDALMSLADRSRRMAEAAAAEGDEGSAELARVQTWRSLASCSELGSLDAFVNMAACSYHGYGTPKNPNAALWFLDKAAHAENGRVTASLWLGDLYYAGKDREPSPVRADEAYLTAISLPDTESECGAYTLKERRENRRRAAQTARAEACYRLATLRAIHFAAGEDIRPAFPYLVKAVLMGHAEARKDLARMYAYESAYTEATSPKDQKNRNRRTGPAGLYARHRLKRRAPDSETGRDSRPSRSHEGWMTDYYTALWPKPALFKYGMESTSAPADRPAYVSADVTPAMLAAALNYLGDCLFFGEGLPKDQTSAAACYREVAGMRIPLQRGESLPRGVVWAQYSYGWCLLHGVGVPEDPRAAVRCLIPAAKTHAEACYALGECYENGIGVDVPDGVEAFKYYRKSMKLGYRKAEAKVKELEKKLRAEA